MPPVTVVFAFVMYLVLVNAVTIWMFHADKRAAITGGWRIPETRLLIAACLGGSPGARAAQLVLRHKTRKQPFAGLLRVILGLQTAALLAFGLVLSVPTLRLAALQQVGTLLAAERGAQMAGVLPLAR